MRLVRIGEIYVNPHYIVSVRRDAENKDYTLVQVSTMPIIRLKLEESVHFALLAKINGAMSDETTTS